MSMSQIKKEQQPVEQIYKSHGFCIYHQNRELKNLNFALQIEHQEKI